MSRLSGVVGEESRDTCDHEAVGVNRLGEKTEGRMSLDIPDQRSKTRKTHEQKGGNFARDGTLE
jgi:hypothetical protein